MSSSSSSQEQEQNNNSSESSTTSSVPAVATTAINTTPSPSPSTNTTTLPSTSSSSWTLPKGIEDDIEQALIKTAVGAVAGGLFGVIFLRSGNGRRAASVATGIGVSFGSTYERIKLRYNSE
ncbi:hypothetical protein FRACYDRAFT_269578 [Fragilariopsis cylindrus CCMP1102]|uniref:Uncharacterized protein n=1 Tax=Fragilariopsis cylindrus CCMP1102 TaxID=635003 RepID=A0A1E7F8R0_9STRA|nr:hypothetical protein FRACYDRAFT_269578 [Fragilariopsis cylindrus CCMP1102]|eukprot:OEU14405.1 hypothetical protein FRACYDRAFT_269578 [Fragilariopsis cylindrus CCMP1102]